MRKSNVGNFSKNKTSPPRVWLYKYISQHLETAMEPGLFCVFYFPLVSNLSMFFFLIDNREIKIQKKENK